MTQEQFKSQVSRLIKRFGDRAFDNEFVLLVWREVDTMNAFDFTRTVDVFIGSRSHNKPPLLSEFREARLAIEKNALTRDIRGACTVLQHPAMRPLADVLRKDFGAVENVKDALQIARLKLQTKGDE